MPTHRKHEHIAREGHVAEERNGTTLHIERQRREAKRRWGNRAQTRIFKYLLGRYFPGAVAGFRDSISEFRDVKS
jgi:hypothetical protein